MAGTAAVGFETHFALVRFLPDGTLDNTFGTGGKTITDTGSSFSLPSAIALQADGKIVTAGIIGTSTFFDIVMVRYTTTGTPDSTFGSAGVVVTSVEDEDQARAMAIQPDGKILLAGYSALNGTADYIVIRYQTDGSLDEDFGAGGVVATDVSNIDLASSMLLLPDGKILVGGNTNYQNFANEDVGLVQYNPDGSLDTNFGDNGKMIIADGTIGFVWSMARQPDGKIFIAGESGLFNDIRWALIRTLPNGALDEEFGFDGGITTDLPGDHEFPAVVLIQPDSKVVMAGRVGPSTDYNFAVARYNAGLNLQATVNQLPTCYGGDDASISIIANGGVPPYEYSINGVDFQNSNVFTGLSAGIYTITVLDSTGASSEIGIEIVEPPLPPTVSLQVVDNNITVQVDTVNGFFQFSDDGGQTYQTSPVFSNLANDVYGMVVIDGNGCIIFNEPITINFTSVNNAGNDLFFELSPNPGNGLCQLKMAGSQGRDLQLRVTDLSGKTVYTGIIPGTAKEQLLDLRFLANGPYFLQLGEGEKWQTKKLVIAH